VVHSAQAAQKDETLVHRWTAYGVSALIAAGAMLSAAELSAAETNPTPAPGTSSPNTPATPDAQQKPGNNSLSEKLDKNEGVLKPPGGIDPEMRVPPEKTHDKMPVIIPPGEPGGDQSVQPK
jgi:hypothetical protein